MAQGVKSPCSPRSVFNENEKMLISVLRVVGMWLNPTLNAPIPAHFVLVMIRSEL